MTRDELKRVVVHEVGAILALVVIELLPVDLEAGIRVTRRAPRQLPQAILVKAEMLRSLEPALKLPFADHAGAIARVAK